MSPKCGKKSAAKEDVRGLCKQLRKARGWSEAFMRRRFQAMEHEANGDPVKLAGRLRSEIKAAGRKRKS